MCIIICSFYKKLCKAATSKRFGDECVLNDECIPAEQVRNEGIMALYHDDKAMLVRQVLYMRFHVIDVKSEPVLTKLMPSYFLIASYAYEPRPKIIWVMA